ncbi:glycerate kinase [Saccharomonospora xinjiangensis]|uniref:Glycerate kinase n=1 Tax=Saccharomonospora xinjiangensis XJ-54 TaxID=882086 RepID=I0UYH6_9PSEU|nr:glycerate kinase [Saccharomonospora xinjiangensis]EID52929.1 glycerate kinase [Saccharomonospora xinjiangensis XJ-54]
MHVVVAPDKFKGCLTAVEAADAMAAGVRDAAGDARIDRCPVADGGEGTLDVLVASGGRRVDVEVTGPLSRPVAARYVVLGGSAYVESASACGISYVEPSARTALLTHTQGVGELIRHAVEGGARGVVLTVGGTASTDGGAGMLRALGATVHDARGNPVPLGGGALTSVATVDLTAARRLLDGIEFRVATDVTNPLLGRDGAAAVFGPQKGAGPREVEHLETGLRTCADALLRAGGRDIAAVPGSGAGGGVAGAAMTIGAQVESGFDLVASLTGIDDAVRGADLVITGEGSLDAQSLAGKAPAGVADRAHGAGVPVAVVAGRITLSPADLAEAGFTAWRALVDQATSKEDSLRRAAELLREATAAIVGDRIAQSP